MGDPARPVGIFVAQAPLTAMEHLVYLAQEKGDQRT